MPTAVEKTIERQETKATRSVQQMLLWNAIDCTTYVAHGKVATRELAEQFGITEDAARKILTTTAEKLKKLLRTFEETSDEDDSASR